jgi:hypothetical protein
MKEAQRVSMCSTYPPSSAYIQLYKITPTNNQMTSSITSSYSHIQTYVFQTDAVLDAASASASLCLTKTSLVLPPPCLQLRYQARRTNNSHNRHSKTCNQKINRARNCAIENGLYAGFITFWAGDLCKSCVCVYSVRMCGGVRWLHNLGFCHSISAVLNFLSAWSDLHVPI